MENKNLPDMTVIKGIIAVCLGIILIICSYSIMLRMLCFVAGALLVYYGVCLLNIPAINNALSYIKTHIQKVLK